jgi:hypothetical protein
MAGSEGGGYDVRSLRRPLCEVLLLKIAMGTLGVLWFCPRWVLQ